MYTNEGSSVSGFNNFEFLNNLQNRQVQQNTIANSQNIAQNIQNSNQLINNYIQTNSSIQNSTSTINQNLNQVNDTFSFTRNDRQNQPQSNNFPNINNFENINQNNRITSQALNTETFPKINLQVISK